MIFNKYCNTIGINLFSLYFVICFFLNSVSIVFIFFIIFFLKPYQITSNWFGIFRLGKILSVDTKRVNEE